MWPVRAPEERTSACPDLLPDIGGPLLETLPWPIADPPLLFLGETPEAPAHARAEELQQGPDGGDGR